MAYKATTYYKYRSFDLNTLHSICEDTIYFSPPSAFNDPFDSRPTLLVDSSLDDLRSLLAIMIQRRVGLEVKASLKSIRMGQERTEFYVTKSANLEAKSALDYVAYHATNPEYVEGPIEAERQLLEGEIGQELLQHYERGVCCFSDTYGSALLWSHYGDQHRGICIGYTTDRIPAPQPERVIYGGNRCIKTSLLLSAFLREEPAAKRRLERDVLLRKAKDWSYESEWRLIGRSGVQESPLLMKEITFGLRCPRAVRHAVVKALTGRKSAPLRFFEMRESPRQYTLKRKLLDVEELGFYYPTVAMSGVEMFQPSGQDESD